MRTKDDILETLRSHGPRLASEFGVRRIGLFGSYARGQQHETSDLDFVAELDRPLGLKFVELVEYLERLFGKKVDVLTPAGVDAIRNPWVAADILKTLIYA
jgi:predicted nucleotidyltransferase